MLQAVLFDLGGTLDGDGEHWLDRFARAYAATGLLIPRTLLRDAFDEAERRALADEAIATARLGAMVERHVGWQLERLSIDNPHVHSEVVARFVEATREVAVRSRSVLSALAEVGFRLGVVSNGAGNVDRLCDELGFSEFLSVVLDSRRVRVFKPDPAIYRLAAAHLGLPPSSVMMVGDSFDRDVRPARAIGMRTAWLEGPRKRPCPDSALVDVRLSGLSELPTALAAYQAAARAVAS